MTSLSSNSSSMDPPPVNFRSSNPTSLGLNNSGNVSNNDTILNTPLGRVFTSSVPPPVPPRTYSSLNNTFGSGFNSYSSPYGSHLYGGYSPFGGYGSYGGYGLHSYRPTFGAFGTAYPESRFIQFAEEASRPAFQTIQSILHAFSSITMMFESSFHAIYSSYMSVLGVADNFAKLRSSFGQVLSTLAIIKTLNSIFQKLLFFLGFNKENYNNETIWCDALQAASTLDSNENNKNKRKTWSMLLFMSLIIGGPYLVFKVISELQPYTKGEIWIPEEQPGSLAVGLYDFHAASERELTIASQQKIMIAPKKFQPQNCPGWVLACNENKKVGLVPQNYIGMLMQSEKTGQTYLEHNGQAYQSSFSAGTSETTKNDGT